MLGMLAMLGAAVSVPLSASHALQMAAGHHGQDAVSAKHCPNCPQQTCPDLGNCLAKCTQQLTPPIEARLHRDVPRDRIPPAAAHESAGVLTPQLLRPPSA
jgi:hypothetical protein